MAFINHIILNGISSFLDQEDLLRARCVNRSFKVAADRFYTTKCFLQLGQHRNTCDELLQYLADNPLTNVTNLKIIHVDLSSASFLQVLSICGPTVTRLNIDPTFYITTNIPSLVEHFPNIQQLRLRKVFSHQSYADQGLWGTLNLKRLSIDQEIESTINQQDGERGMAIKSLMLSCKELNKIVLTECVFPERGLSSLAAGNGCSKLFVLDIGHRVEARVLSDFFNASNKNTFNKLELLKIDQLVEVDGYQLFNLFKFLAKQSNLRTIWIPYIRKKAIFCCVDQHLLAENSQVFQQLGSLTNITTLNLPPLFNLKVLESCLNLNTLVLSQMFSSDLYGLRDGAQMTEFVFEGMQNPLNLVKRVRLNFSAFDCPDDSWDIVLAWFPGVYELEINGAHPDCLPKIWKFCKRTTKLKLQLAVRRWDFHLDAAFTGYSTTVCDAKRNETVCNLYEPIIREIRSYSLLDLQDLCSLELEFRTYYGKAIWIYEERDDLKMTDFAFMHAVLIHPKLQHFEFGEYVDGNFACVKIGIGTCIVVQKRLTCRESRISCWNPVTRAD